MSRTAFVLALTVTACGGTAPPAAIDAAPQPPTADAAPAAFLLTVSPSTVIARQQMSPLTFEFHTPVDLAGGGIPTDLTTGFQDLSVAELELPQGRGSTDEAADHSTGLVNFDPPIFCKVGDITCTLRGMNGYWSASIVSASGATREVQMGVAMRDLVAAQPYDPVIGVFLAAGDTLKAGDTLRLVYTGVMTGRATDWTDQPFLAHFRYRTFDSIGAAGNWTVLDDDQVEPLSIGADTLAKYVRVIAPLDVQVGVPFAVTVVVTDHFGNPRTVTGSIDLTGDVSATVQLSGEWTKTVDGVMYGTPGAHVIRASFPGVRGVAQYQMAWSGPPPLSRWLGDVHSHSGDGGAQRKFIGTFGPGDHRGLFARTHDALRYMHEVAGLDFGAVSEHSVRWDAYTPPAAVAADPVFQTGGACAGVGHSVPAIGAWWQRQQMIVEDYQSEVGLGFVAFPAFEWHATHTVVGDRSPLHRVVLFKDFAADASTQPLPILPGDLANVPPQCIVRFLADAGYGPDKALVVPHMMSAKDNNIDWDLTYMDTPVATRATTATYYRVGEIYSARAIDQQQPYGIPTLTVFEGADQSPGPWAYRYGWKDLGTHIGVIGSSDNHEQMPGTNDDLDLDGVNFHINEPGGYAVVLAPSLDRDALFAGLTARRTYATSGVRAWFDYSVDGAEMGARLMRNVASVDAHVALMAGMTITHVEVWGAPVGGVGQPYTLVQDDQPDAETYTGTITLDNPVTPGGASQEWLYYVRAFLQTPGSTNDADEAVWSSPVWVVWSN
jgi:hypothetical protein